MPLLSCLEPFGESFEAVRNAAVRLESWLAKPLRLRLLVPYRVGFGLLVAANGLSWLPHATERFSSAGFHIGFLAAWAPSPALATGLVLTVVGAGLLFAAGCLTRVANFVLLLVWGYLYSVDQIGEKAVDSIVLVVLSLTLFLPLGRSAGLDARWFGREEFAPGLPVRLLQLEFVQIYFFAGLTKLMRADWRTGKTLYESLMSRWAHPWTPGLAAELSSDTLLVLAWGTILFEIGIGFLLMRRAFSVPARLACLSFHGAIQMALGIGYLGLHFALATLTLYRRSLLREREENRACDPSS